MKIVICGVSAAGLSCLDNLYKIDRNIDCTLISEEPFYPYSRCLLTYYLAKELLQKEMEIANPDVYEDNIKWVFGERVIKIDVKNQIIVTNNGNIFNYDKLLLATGAEAIKTSYMHNNDRIFNLRYLKDAQYIDKKLKSSALVVGGGFVGIKTAYGLMNRGIKTTLIIASSYPLSTTVDEETGNLVKHELDKMDVEVFTGTDIVETKVKNGSLISVLSNGRILTTDIAIVGKGVKPRVDLAKFSGIKVENGIIVDDYLRTSVENVYAAGDCCETYDIVRKKRAVNAIWPNAVEQGRYVAFNMMGYEMVYPGSIAMNSIKTNTFHLISAGDLKAKDATVFTNYSKSKNQFIKIAVKDNKIVGCAFLNCHEYAGVVVELIKSGKEVLLQNVKEIVKGTISPLDIYRYFGRS